MTTTFVDLDDKFVIKPYKLVSEKFGDKRNVFQANSNSILLGKVIDYITKAGGRKFVSSEILEIFARVQDKIQNGLPPEVSSDEVEELITRYNIKTKEAGFDHSIIVASSFIEIYIPVKDSVNYMEMKKGKSEGKFIFHAELFLTILLYIFNTRSKTTIEVGEYIKHFKTLEYLYRSTYGYKGAKIKRPEMPERQEYSILEQGTRSMIRGVIFEIKNGFIYINIQEKILMNMIMSKLLYYSDISNIVKSVAEKKNLQESFKKELESFIVMVQKLKRDSSAEAHAEIQDLEELISPE